MKVEEALKETIAERKEREKRKQRIKAVALSILLITLTLIVFRYTTITGMITRLITKPEHVQDLSILINENQTYDWILSEVCTDANCYINSVRISGKIIGNDGYAKVYLEDIGGNRYLIFDKSIEESGKSPLTGMGGLLEIPEHINQTVNETTTTTIPNQTTTTIVPNQTTTTTTPNETTMTTIETTTTTTTSTTTIPNQTTTTSTTSTTTSTTTTSMTTTTTLPIEIDFNNECIETCDLSGKSLNESSFILIFELSEGVTINIDTISYSWQLEKEIALPKKAKIEKSVVKDSKGRTINSILILKDSRTKDLIESISTDSEATIDMGEYDIEMLPEQHPVKKLSLKNVRVNKKLEKLVDLDDVPESIPTPEDVNEWTEVYAIDPTELDFAEAEVTVTAKGNALYKCKDWDFAAQSCYGEWVKIMEMTPGENYTFTLTQEDPGFGEANITIINVRSYPTLYGNWTVRFNTIGTADLTVTAVNGTGFGRDIEFLELRCGDNVLTTELTDGVAFVENYSCNETGHEISKVLIAGKHTLEFRFGDDVEYAYNDVVVYETGIVQNVNGWTLVALDTSYTNPVVIVTGQEGADISMDVEASRPMIRNVSSNSFEVQVVNDGTNVVEEDVGYIVMEEGHWTVDGVEVEAGTYSVSSAASTQTVTYAETFPGNTVVIDTLQTECSETVSSRYIENSMGSSSFQVWWEDFSGLTSETNSWSCGAATAGYIAVELGNSSSIFESGIYDECTADPGSSDWCSITFSNSYASTPILFVNPHDVAGSDSAIVGRRSLSTTGVDLRSTESRTADAEQDHATDDMPWIVWTDVDVGAPPTYFNNSTNTTVAGQPTLFSLNWTSEKGLSGYIFSLYNGSDYQQESCSGTAKDCSEHDNEDDCELCGCTWSGSDYNQTVMDLNPEARWLLNGDGTDSSGNGHNSDAETTPVFVDNIIPNNDTAQCGDFVPNDEYQIPDSPRINTGTGYAGTERALSVWIIADTIDTTGNGRAIWTEGGGSNSLNMYTFNNGTHDNIYCNAVESANYDYVYTQINEGELLHVGCMFNFAGGRIDMYINGTLVSSDTSLVVGTSLASHSGDCAIGGQDSNTDNHLGASMSANFDGRIADLVYWSDGSVITQQNFSGIYQAGIDTAGGCSGTQDSCAIGTCNATCSCTHTPYLEFHNDTWTAFSGTTWSNVTKIVNSTTGATIKWCVYANDTNDRWNGTSCQNPFSYITTAGVSNNAPVLTSVDVTTSSPNTTETLDCGAKGYDVDAGEVLKTNFTWYRDTGTDYVAWTSDDETEVATTNDTYVNTSATGDIESADTAKTYKFICQATLYDDGGASDIMNSSAVTVVNSPPNPDSSWSPGTTHDPNQDFTWSEGSDDDGDGVTSYLCIDDDSSGRDNEVCDAYSNSGLDSPVEDVTLTYDGASKTYYGRLTATDGQANSTDYDFTFTLTNAQPSAPSAAYLDGQTTNDTTPTITFTKGTDSDTSPVDTVTQYISVDSSGYTDSGDTYTTSGDINQFTIDPDLSDGTYYVREWTDDGTGSSNTRSDNYEYTFTVTSVIRIYSITIEPDEGDPGIVVDPLADLNKTVNVTVVVANSTTIDTCEIRIFNATSSYANPVFQYIDGTVQNCGTMCECFKEWGMEYWRNDGSWNVSVDINVTNGPSNFTSQNFTYNALTSFDINTSTITFGGIPGQTVNSSDAYPLQIKNTGNQILDFSLNGSDFIGLGDASYVVRVNNATYNESVTGEFRQLTDDYYLAYSNTVGSGFVNVWFRAYLPVGFIEQGYQDVIEVKGE